MHWSTTLIILILLLFNFQIRLVICHTRSSWFYDSMIIGLNFNVISLLIIYLYITTNYISYFKLFLITVNSKVSLFPIYFYYKTKNIICYAHGLITVENLFTILMLSNFHILLTFLFQSLCFVVIYDAMRFIWCTHENGSKTEPKRLYL